MKLRIGSRGSKLAVAQAEWVGSELKKKDPGLDISYARITTTGDREGQYDAIVIAYAGLKRLALESEIIQVLEADVMMPAPGQGCLGLQIRDGDDATASLLEKIKDGPSDTTARAERAFLQGLGGN